MKKIFTLTTLLVLALTVNAQGYRKWDFTNWSSTTVANLQVEAATGVTGGNWSDIEKSNGDTPGGGVCFWSYNNNVDADGNLTANGAVIAETEGLIWNTSYTSRRSLALAVNYPSTSLGEYAGPQYLWLGGGNKSGSARIACFTIPKVRIGQKITITAESHKPSDARGVSLFVNSCTDDANQIGESFKPKTLESYTWEEGWTLPEGVTAEGETVDIIVYNTNGCHLYSIEVGDDTQASEVGYLYNGTLDNDLAYPHLAMQSKFKTTAIEATGAFTMDQLTAYDAIVISSTVNNAEAIASLKAIQPFVPTLNLNPALYETWGYGTIGTAGGQQFASVTNRNHALFKGIDIYEDNDIVAVQITNEKDYKGVTLTDYFADDLVLAKVLESEDVAIHVHNGSHNAYLFLPLTQEVMADVATPALLSNGVSFLINSKAKVTAAAKPVIKLDYKHMNTNVTLSSNAPMAQIFYTLDGSEPTEQSTLYTEPFNVNTVGVTVKAVAKGDGYLLSEVAEEAVALKQQLSMPEISVVKGDKQSTVTLSYSLTDVPFKLFYNYTGTNDSTKSVAYTEPIIVSKPRNIYAFAAAEGFVNSELASAFVDVENAQVRLDVLAHMDANSTEYNNGSTSTAYYFSWGKNKSGENGHPYYNPEVYTETTETDPETGDEIIHKTYTELNTEEEVDFQNGWAIRSRGQIVDWENLTSGTAYGDNNGYNFASIEDNDPDFPATKGLINLADKNTEPTDATFPYNAYILSTQKFKGPFDVIAYVGSIVKPTNDAKHQFVIQASVDGNAWDSDWQVLGDTMQIENKQRLTTKVVRSYEGTDEVYVRLYLTNFNSKIGIYDIYIANAGEKTQEFLTGIEEIAPVRNEQPALIFDVKGVRQSSMKRGLNILRYSDGTTKKVMVK